LAEAAHVSPATALRRVRRLVEAGVIERQVAIVAPHQAPGLTAICEVTLDKQGAEHLAAFEVRAVADEAVQQCYRVSPGPDFILVLWVHDMPAYHALVQRLFTQDANVRNVKAFFSVSRAKFEPKLRLRPTSAPPAP
jgi:DNA-binding Lrp family transcriptional regulator